MRSLLRQLSGKVGQLIYRQTKYGTVVYEAPTFSGETQFTESTQVTMSGPDGASIFYTVDGSTPTDQSLEYEEPITLSATTTVKAIAVKDSTSSTVTSRTFTKGDGENVS